MRTTPKITPQKTQSCFPRSLQSLSNLEKKKKIEKTAKKASTRLCIAVLAPNLIFPSYHDLFWFVQAWAATLKSTNQNMSSQGWFFRENFPWKSSSPVVFVWEENTLHPNCLAHSLPQDMSLLDKELFDSCWWPCCMVVSYEAPCNANEINYRFTSSGLQKPTSFRC